MKKTRHYFAITITICLACFLSACNTVNRTMIDASVPKEEQSALVVVDSDGEWDIVTLAFVDKTPYYKRGSIFYIPSGLHTLGIDLTSSSSERNFTEPDVITTTTWSGRGQLRITEELLPGHTYRMIVNSYSDIRIEDITDSVDFPSPKKALLAPGKGVLTNWDTPRGFFFTPGIRNVSWSLQYTALPGIEAKAMHFTKTTTGEAVEKSYTTVISERGITGMKTFSTSMALQGGVELGFRKFRTSLLAELNGGVGYKGETYEVGRSNWGLNWGYLFLAEMYHPTLFGIGFGYGKKTAVFPFLDTTINYGAQAAYQNQFPHFRFELFFNPGKTPITLFGDYFFEHKGWSAGISMHFAPKGDSIFPKVFLR